MFAGIYLLIWHMYLCKTLIFLSFFSAINSKIINSTMTTKRKYSALNDADETSTLKKHTLDSDEDDSDDYEKDDLNDSDIEGGEEGVAKIENEVKITPFNMREELEEGHFDKEGQYHWNKDSDIKDNWLDNIDWVKVETDKNYLNSDKNENSNDSSSSSPNVFNATQAYVKLLEYMEPRETIQKALQRLGKNRPKLSSVERLRRKKQGIEDTVSLKIFNLTELANEILSRTGNMDIYQETYEIIKSRLNNTPSTSKAAAKTEAFDMYADDFEEKEKERLKLNKNVNEDEMAQPEKKDLLWEFKWKQDDNNLQGPFTTETMLKWSREKYFKEGVYVRKVGEESNFYTSNRIDFDLYL